MSQPHEYTALKFLNQWHNKEMYFHNGLSGRRIDDQALSKAMHYFKVARNFSGLGEEGATSLISDLLINSSRRINQKNFPDRVHALALEFQLKFGSYNLSAASKLLWLRNRDPIIIFDKNTRHSLILLGHKIPPSDYSGFLRAWRIEFSKAEKDIRRASKRIPGISEFSSMWEHKASDIKEVVTSDWFTCRVFDILLWDIANKSFKADAVPERP
jgi:hypothetical protein